MYVHTPHSERRSGRRGGSAAGGAPASSSTVAASEAVPTGESSTPTATEGPATISGFGTVQGACEDTRHGGLTNTSRPTKQIGMGQAVLEYGISEGGS